MIIVGIEIIHSPDFSQMGVLCILDDAFSMIAKKILIRVRHAPNHIIQLIVKFQAIAFIP